MAFTVDPEIAAGIVALRGKKHAQPPVGDWKTRQQGEEGLLQRIQPHHLPPGISAKDIYFDVGGDPKILPRWYSKTGFSFRKAVLYTHDGGVIFANVSLFGDVVAKYVESG